MSDSVIPRGAGAEPSCRPRSLSEKIRLMRMVLEGIYFEKETADTIARGSKKPEVLYGLFLACLMALAQGFLLSMWAARDARHRLGPEEVASLRAAQTYRQAASSGKLMELIKSPLDEDGLPRPPLYYWTLALTSPEQSGRPPSGTGLQTVYLAILCMSVYLITRRSRTEPASLVAAAFASSLPFVLGCMRQLSPELALIAFTAAAYAAFIWSDDFESAPWTFVWGIFSLLGMLTSWVYPLCTIPLMNLLFYGIMNHVTRANVMRVFWVWAGVYLLWLSNNMVPIMQWVTHNVLPGMVVVSSVSIFENLRQLAMHTLSAMPWYLVNSADWLQIPFFIAASVMGLWFFTTQFAVYPYRRDICYWLFAPLLFVSLLPQHRAEYYLPSLAAVSVMLGVMSPRKFYFWILGGLFVFSAAYQLGALPSLHITTPLGRVALVDAGRRKPYGQALGRVLQDAARLAAARGQSVVAVSKNPSLEPYYLNWLAERAGFKPLSFMWDDAGFSVYPAVVLDVRPPGAAPAKSPLFGDMARPDPVIDAYEARGSYKLDTGDVVTVLAQRDFRFPPFKSAAYSVKRLKFAGFIAEDVLADIGPWDPDRQSYRWINLTAGSIRLGKGDVFGVSAVLQDCRFITASPATFEGAKILKLGTLRLTSGIVDSDNIGEAAHALIPQLSDLKMEIHLLPGQEQQHTLSGLSLSGKYNDSPFSGSATIERSGASDLFLKFNPLNISYWTVPDFMLNTLQIGVHAAPTPTRPFWFVVSNVVFDNTSISIRAD
ncbi:MAG: glycosyltransferase family 39 protein [Elusimicrobiales bacterium]